MRPTRSVRSAVAAAAVGALLFGTAGCGGTTDGGRSGAPDSLDAACLNVECGESGLEDAGKPQRGGTIVYGVESETSSGFCLPEAELSLPGMLVVRALYDTLTVPNAEGGYVPYLAKTVEPNDDFTVWTITVRDGIEFHDGSKLTGEVVKNNLDALRGTYPARKPLLSTFALSNIDTTAADGQTVTVTTKVPWVAFPAFLYGNSRYGIMAQAQLDDPETCGTKPIGTGPFVFDEWSPNDHLTATRNPHYWQTAPDGKPYPYADAIEFRPITDAQVRANSVRSADGANIMHTDDPDLIGNSLLDGQQAGDLNLLVSEVWSEPTFIQLNTTAPPFDDERMRRALAVGLDREALNERQNGGLATVADGPFAPGSSAYLEDPGFPAHDAAEATKLVDDYLADGGSAEVSLTVSPAPNAVRNAEAIQQQLKEVGIEIRINKRLAADLVDDAVGKKYQAMLFRNFPGGDPDINYGWWYGGDNLLNFSGFSNDEIDQLLDEGRSNPDEAARVEAYQRINEVFAEELYDIWTWYTPWAVAERADVHGILGPPLPGADPSEPGPASTDDPALQPNPGLATGHSLLGLWVDQDS